jgi:hypothetical protein
MYTIIGIIAFIIFLFIGIAIWARSDLPMIQREIAINTRQEKDNGPEYNAVKVLSAVYKIGAFLVILAGIIALVLIIKYGQISESGIPKFKI